MKGDDENYLLHTNQQKAKQLTEYWKNIYKNWCEMNQTIINSIIYKRLIFILVFIDVGFMLHRVNLTANNTIHHPEYQYLEFIQILFISIYWGDLIIKFGSNMSQFFKDRYNILDVVLWILYASNWILDLTWPYYESSLGLRLIRGMQMLRILKFIPMIPSLHSVVSALLYTMRTSVFDVIVLTILTMFVIGVFGHLLFGTDINRIAYQDWATLGDSFLTIWVYIGGDGWLPYQDHLRISGYVGSEWFSLCLIFLGNLILCNLFVGVISQNVYEASLVESNILLMQQMEAKNAKRGLFLRKLKRDMMAIVNQKKFKTNGFQEVVKDIVGKLRHEDIVPSKSLIFDILWLETFVMTLHYHENAIFRCQQNHFALAHALAEWIEHRLANKGF